MHRCNASCVCHKCSCKYEYHNNEDVNKHKCKPFNAASAIAAGIMYIVISDQDSSLVGLPVIMVGAYIFPWLVVGFGISTVAYRKPKKA